MFRLRQRATPDLILAALLIGCVPLPAFSDEIQYLIDNPQQIVSINFASVRTTKSFQEVLKLLPSDKEGPDKHVKEGVDTLMMTRFTRFTMAMRIDAGLEQVMVFTGAKTLTIADVKALSELGGHRDVKFTEIKHGTATLYQESFRSRFDKEGDKPHKGQIYYFPENGKYLVFSSTLDELKQIIDRGKAARMTPGMQAALKEANLKNTISFVMDIEAINATGAKEEFLRDFKRLPNGEEIAANIGKVQALAVTVNEHQGKIKGSAALLCADAAAAGIFKKIGEKALADVKVKLHEEPKGKIPDEMKKMVGSARTLVNSIKISSAGKTVTASVEVDVAVAVPAIGGYFIAPGKTNPPIESKKLEPSGR